MQSKPHDTTSPRPGLSIFFEEESVLEGSAGQSVMSTHIPDPEKRSRTSKRGNQSKGVSQLHDYEEVLKRCRIYHVDTWLQGYLTSSEIVCLYDHGVALPNGWNIETTKDLDSKDPERKVHVWFQLSKKEWVRWMTEIR